MKKRSILLTLGYIILQLFDGLLTWIGTPDLALEANILVSNFGLGWIALFLANILFMCLFAYLAYYSCVIYQPTYTNVYNRKQYLKELFWPRTLKTFNWKAFWAMFGITFCYALIASRIFLIWEWLVYIFKIPVPFYDKMRQSFPGLRWDYILAFLVIIFCIYFWLQKQYRNNEKLHHNS